MDIIQEKGLVSNKTGFFTHVFSTTEESKAEILNVAQYAFLAIIPIVILNKLIQRFIPDVDQDASTIELLAEVILQILAIFVGLVIIHRVISFIPTYSGFKYEPFILTNSILTFLVIVLSLQTKLGLKVNILYERVVDMWSGDSGRRGGSTKGGAKSGAGAGIPHVGSQADNLDNNPAVMLLPPPTATNIPRGSNVGTGSGTGGASGHASGFLDNIFTGNPAVGGSYPTSEYSGFSYGPAPANSMLGSAF